jgi:membrane associated rhomboid family serine protease
MAVAPPPLRCYRHPERETYGRCSECDRPICPDCMTMAPVGIRCPEHSGKAGGAQRVRRAAYEGTGSYVTRVIIGINIGIFALQLATGAPLNGAGGRIWQEMVLHGPWVAQGEWWRLLTSAFLHYGPFHLAMNMYVLWFLGGPLEHAMGRGRYVLLYLVSGLAGAAGALLLDPLGATAGASGAVFGLLGAALVLERQRIDVYGGSVIGLLILNLAITFFVPNISIGGHLGGLAGGALSVLALSRFGRVHAFYGRPGLVGTVSLVTVAALAVGISYWRVKGYA